jgi:ankyrin repeat protein
MESDRFIRACKFGDIKTIQNYLDKGIDINTVDEQKSSGLLFASGINRNIEVVDFLLEKGINVNLQNIDGYTALYEAVRLENIDIVKKLLYHKADPELKPKLHETLLSLCSRRNFLEIAKLLIKNGANVNAQNEMGGTALSSACMNQNIEIINLLINNDANINLSDNNGITPLMIAVRKRNFHIVQLLIENGANCDLQDKFNGYTPLFEACRFGDIEIMKILFFQTNYRLKNKAGKTAIDIYDRYHQNSQLMIWWHYCLTDSKIKNNSLIAA